MSEIGGAVFIADFAEKTSPGAGYNAAMVGVFGSGDWQFWWGVVVTGVVGVVGLFWPGWLVLTKTSLSRGTRFFLAPVVGLVLLTLMAWGAGSAGFYQLVWAFYALLGLAMTVWRGKQVLSWGRRWRELNLTGVKKFLCRQKVLILLIGLGLIIQLPAIIASGWRTGAGAWFYFTNHGDGLMHVGFMNALAQEFPPLRPEMNIPLTDYHYFSDLAAAQLVRLGVPAVNLFFQYGPVLLSIFTTGLVYQVVREVTHSRRAAFWTTLLFLVAGDGSYWLTFFFPHHHGWEMLALDNGADQFLNMPYVYAKLIFVGTWGLLNDWWRRGRGWSLLAVVVLGVSLVGFKVYWWILLVSGWLLAGGWRVGEGWWQARHAGQRWRLTGSQLVEAGVGLATLVGGWLILQTIMSDSGEAALSWAPLVWARIIISDDHLGWTEWYLREQIYQAAGNTGWRVILDNLKMVAVAVFYVYGTRLVGLWTSRRQRRRLSMDNWLFLVGPAVGWMVVGFNVMQGKGGLNSFNFLIIAAVALLIPLGVNLSEWWRWPVGKIGVVVVIALLLPRTVHNWWWYVVSSWTHEPTSSYFYSEQRLDLLAELHRLTTWEELVLPFVDNQDLRAASVIPAIAGRKTYLSNEHILQTHSLDIAEREQAGRKVFEGTAVPEMLARARDLGADYIYLEEHDLLSLPADLIDHPAVVASNSAGLIVKTQLD